MFEQQSPSGWRTKKWLLGPTMLSRISKYGPDLISTLKLATIASYCTQMCLKLIIIIIVVAVQQPKLTLASHQTPPSSPFIGQIHPLAPLLPPPFAQWFRPETSMSANLSSGPPIAAVAAAAKTEQQIVLVATGKPTFLATTANATTTTTANRTELGYKADNATLDREKPVALRVLGMLYNIEIEGRRRRRRHGEADLQQEQQTKLLETTTTTTTNTSLLARQPESLLMGEEEAATTVVTVAASSHSSYPGDAVEATEASAAAAAEDEDVVISSSEILNDNRQMAKLQPLNNHQKPPSHKRKHNTKQETHNQLENPEIGAKNCSGSGGGQDLSAAAAAADEVIASSDSAETPTSTSSFGLWLGSNSAASDDADLRHHLNSRLLLQILVIGLFGLVSLSLMVVYTIKFCVCRRRKRRLILLRRNLVADSAALACAVQQQQPQGGNHALISPAQCTCPAAPQPPARLESLLRPYQTGPGLWTIGGSPMANDDSSQLLAPSSLYQQLALAERLHARQHQMMMMTSGGPMASGGGGGGGSSFCLGCHDTDPNANQNHGQLQHQRPPTYSELFGFGDGSQVVAAAEATEADQQESMMPPEIGGDGRNSISPPPVSTNLTTSSSGRRRRRRQQAAEDETIICGPGVSLSTGEESRSSSNSASSTARDYSGVANASAAGEQNKKNLLVKLNLNKTKLLSADDLVLLSQLIDVPIIVQHQQPPAADAAAGPAVSSCSDDATIDEEDEEEEEDGDGDGDNDGEVGGVERRSFGSGSQSSRQDHQSDGGIIRVAREIGRTKQVNGGGGTAAAAAANDE